MWTTEKASTIVERLFAMLKNYFRIALRHLQKQRALAAINIAGLSVGIACFALLFLFAANELSFDRFHRHARDIYRLYTVWPASSTGDQAPMVFTDYYHPRGKSLGPAIQQFFPDVEDYVRLQLPWGEILLRAGDKSVRTGVSFADASLFSVFDFPLVAGSKGGVLRTSSDMVITASRAVELFGSPEKAMGRRIELLLGTKFFPFTISGVAQDPPVNSTIRFDIIGSYSFMQAHSPDDFVVGNNWFEVVSQTYVRLRPGSRLAGDPHQLARFQRSFTPPGEWKDMGFPDWKKSEPPVTLKMQPLLSIHTDTNFHAWGFTDYQRIDPQTLWILLGIAGGILLIACINFTTLAIARSAVRGKEVGVRKVVGAGRSQIIVQFLTEAILVSGMSALLGLLLANGVLPWFNRLTGRQLHFSLMQHPQLILALTGVVLAAGILAGSYPALVLARFEPAEVFKNKLRIGGSNGFTRALVSFQFALSILLIGCTFVILQQTSFMLNKNPGFDKENVIVIDAAQTDPDKTFPAFERSLLNRPEIVGVTSAAAGIGAGKGFLGYRDGGIKADINVVDTNYMKVLGMRLLVGSNLQPAALGDSLRPVVINETLMRTLGWNLNNVVGQQVKPFQGRIAVIRGVVKNFNYQAVGQPVFNQVFISTPERGFSNFYVRVRPGDPAKALELVQYAWHAVAPGIPLKYSFLDEDVNAFYQSEQTWTSIVASAGAMSVFLACLGLLGLVSLAAVNRRKEMGIRKVLGASVRQLVVLLSTDFLRLVAIAFVIATPIAWLLMSQWLQGYAIRIDLRFSVFLFAGIIAGLAAILAVGFQAIGAARANPVHNLRSE